MDVSTGPRSCQASRRPGSPGGTGARDHPERFASSCGRLDDVMVPKVLEVFSERVEELKIVVNDQNPDPLVCHWGVPRRRSHHRQTQLSSRTRSQNRRLASRSWLWAMNIVMQAVAQDLKAGLPLGVREDRHLRQPRALI